MVSFIPWLLYLQKNCHLGPLYRQLDTTDIRGGVKKKLIPFLYQQLNCFSVIESLAQNVTGGLHLVYDAGNFGRIWSVCVQYEIPYTE